MRDNWTLKTRAAHLACALDTDGWIGLRNTNHTNGHVRLCCNVGITNQSREFLTHLAKSAGVPLNIGLNGKIGRDSRGIVSHKECWQVYWRSPLHVIKILELALPYLIVKRERAVWVLEFVKGRITSNGKVNRSGKPYTERDFELMKLVTTANGNKHNYKGDTAA
ncbi:MAG: hypothetical protein MUP81_00235 [Dehalococcoidia bacterium]|nr:hypothetical protein [Dehalococcoidia bacterium]